MLAPRIFTINAKDFRWELKSKLSHDQSCPLGEGVVDWSTYFKTLSQLNVLVPISLHAEYPLGGADQGKTTLSLPSEQVKAALKQDLQRLKGYLSV